MNLEELVPPLELCKKIPAGEFEQSALVIFKWENVKEPCIYERLSVAQTHIDNGRKKGYCFPAPTLQEIMEVLPDNNSCVSWFCQCHGKVWGIGCEERDLYVKNGTENRNPATAALKVWLELKGIE